LKIDLSLTLFSEVFDFNESYEILVIYMIINLHDSLKFFSSLYFFDDNFSDGFNASKFVLLLNNKFP